MSDTFAAATEIREAIVDAIEQHADQIEKALTGVALDLNRIAAALELLAPKPAPPKPEIPF